MSNNFSNRAQVQGFLDLIEADLGKVKGIDLRVYNDDLYIICECLNLDGRRFIEYLRGGNKDQQYIRCMECGDSIPFSEYQEKLDTIKEKYKNNAQ